MDVTLKVLEGAKVGAKISIKKPEFTIGRSQGCFAFSKDDIGQVLWRLGPGSLLYADKA